MISFFFMSTMFYFNAQDLILTNASYIDVINGMVVNDQDILIKNGSISKIADAGVISFPKNIISKDCSNLYVMPGLIDAHVHLFQSGGLYTRPDAVNLQGIRPYEDEIDWIDRHLESMLNRYVTYGITTIVDVGGPMRNFKYRDIYKSKPSTPNIFLTGPLVSTYLPPAFQIEDPPIVKVERSEEAINLVNEQLSYHPDFIKIWYIDLPYFPADSAFEMIKDVVQESHRLDLPVAIHATELNTAKLAIKAGGDYLVHSVSEPIDDEFIQLCLDNDVVLSPSLKVSTNYDLVFAKTLKPSIMDFERADPFVLGTLFDPYHLEDHPAFIQYKKYAPRRYASNHQRDSIQQINLLRLERAGVTIATGTDAGNIGTLHTASYFDELDAMQRSGMSNKSIIQASTINASKAAGKDDQVGALMPRMIADLILLEGNPLENLDHLKKIRNVIKSGEWIEPDSILKPSPQEIAQQQLNAYNAHDIEAFLAPYAEDVKIYNFPGELVMSGKDAMRSTYGSLFERSTDLHCRLVSRIVQGNTVIDQEEVIFHKGEPLLKAIAIYKIQNDKIQEVYFVRNSE